MRIVVLGSGVVGVTAAWYLAEAGHDVVVVDRKEGPALETSFANAGEISPGYASPWAAPAIPWKAVRWLLMRHPPLIVKPRPAFAMLRCGAGMLTNYTAREQRANTGRKDRQAA